MHKRETVVGRIKKDDQIKARRRLQVAYLKATPQTLDAELRLHAPRAASSLVEGLEETLTLHKLGLAAELVRSLHTTNLIENVNSCMGARPHRVKRWVNSHQRQWQQVRFNYNRTIELKRNLFVSWISIPALIPSCFAWRSWRLGRSILAAHQIDSIMKRLLGVVTLVCLLCACEGPTGPVGPAGPPGVAGPAGEKGDPGNSNMSTVTVTLVATQFEDDASTGVESAVFPSTLISASVVDRGAVLAYADLGTSGQVWTALPLQIDNVSLTYGFETGVAEVIILRPPGTLRAAGVFGGHQGAFSDLDSSGGGPAQGRGHGGLRGRTGRGGGALIINRMPPEMSA